MRVISAMPRSTWTPGMLMPQASITPMAGLWRARPRRRASRDAGPRQAHAPRGVCAVALASALSG
jgi:hypothetical protein